MNVIDRFETFVERLMERSFTRVTGTELQPVEIGKRIVRAMEQNQSVGVEGVIVPNVYAVFLSEEDYHRFKPAAHSISKNLETQAARAARQRQYHMLTRPVVLLDLDRSLPTGDLRVEAHLQDVEEKEIKPEPIQQTSVLPQINLPVELPAPAAPLPPSLVLNGQTFAVLRSPTKLGRMPTNDIVLDDKRVSRDHAEVVQADGQWLIRDKGSTNGTSVNGKIIKEAVLKPGDTISLGGLEITWQQ